MKVNKKILTYAKTQRKSNNPWETKLWYFLRNGRMSEYKFKRQVPIGKYIVDFCCHEKRLVIELDGGHHTKSHQFMMDKIKELHLRQENFRILRFWNSEIDSNIEGVLEKIEKAL